MKNYVNGYVPPPEPPRQQLLVFDRATRRFDLLLVSARGGDETALGEALAILGQLTWAGYGTVSDEPFHKVAIKVVRLWQTPA